MEDQGGSAEKQESHSNGEEEEENGTFYFGLTMQMIEKQIKLMIELQQSLGSRVKVPVQLPPGG
ncbi:unnamed protein product [Acanthoscelides obtectus]|uniref:Uncharacterized protein n=1 Tax=Acanthoscelides obtectus TaxID=200917 RepID=A0A9P0MJN7_ACAOB|nr:unnamed protein product [Acanthoscelides obtectus]CAK1680785.1 hypothetical protein AOBTE_LOCUS32877 [Acanthoscelides obtectus]